METTNLKKGQVRSTHLIHPVALKMLCGKPPSGKPTALFSHRQSDSRLWGSPRQVSTLTHTHPWDAHYGPVYPSMFTPDVCIPLCSLCTCVSPLYSLRTWVSLYVHYGPVYPSVPTTDLHFPLCSLRLPLYTYQATVNLTHITLPPHPTLPTQLIMHTIPLEWLLLHL